MTNIQKAKELGPLMKKVFEVHPELRVLFMQYTGAVIGNSLMRMHPEPTFDIERAARAEQKILDEYENALAEISLDQDYWVNYG